MKKRVKSYWKMVNAYHLLTILLLKPDGAFRKPFIAWKTPPPMHPIAKAPPQSSTMRYGQGSRAYSSIVYVYECVCVCVCMDVLENLTKSNCKRNERKKQKSFEWIKVRVISFFVLINVKWRHATFFFLFYRFISWIKFNTLHLVHMLLLMH